MKFAKRQVREILIEKNGHWALNHSASADIMITVYAYEDRENTSQLLVVEKVNKITGEVTTIQINLPVTDMYVVTIWEILEVQQ
jgi:hypothetical protein